MTRSLPMSALLLPLALTLYRSALAEDYVAGYMIIPTANRIDKSYNGGFSMYVAVWPLLNAYPGHQFQTGLPGTWMFAQYDGPAPKDMYSDVEGGLGWWRDTRFPTEIPKFIMGGVGPNFSAIANGPSHGWGTWEEPKGLYGVAQLSPWLLFPIDGLNLKQGTCGQLFGYGYLPLPLTEPKQSTGGNCWTLFINSGNFKGPVAFFLPSFWSQEAPKDPRLAGQLLDSRPAEPNTALQMETQYIPCRRVADRSGQQYLRVAPAQWPVDPDGATRLMHGNVAYSKGALWDGVLAWFNGGKPNKGRVDDANSMARTFKESGYMTWEVRSDDGSGKEIKVPLDWQAFVEPAAIDQTTFGCKWKGGHATKSGSKMSFPEYFKLVEEGSKKARWIPVAPSEVPGDTGLHKIVWQRPKENPQEPYTTPTDPKSCWKKPGPAAGPFKANLGDGSVVTYYWYRFADQPALLNAGLTSNEREKLQKRVEMLHRLWKKDREYLAPPKKGKLADVDPAQIVRPPKGLEIGYVPIATRQEMARRK